VIKLPEEGVWKGGIWLGSTVSLLRNLALYKFPAKMNPSEKAGSFKVISEALHKIPALEPLQMIPAESLSLVDKELLFEHFHCARGFHEAEAGCGFVFDSTTLITLNLYNHLELYAFDATDKLIPTWGSLSQLCEEFAALHLTAFSPRFGYLTSNPLYAGTTLEARLFFHIPALRHTQRLPQLLTTLKDEQLSFESLEGPLADLPGDILIVRNHYTLGVSEETLLNLLRTTALKIVAAEKGAREALKAKPSPNIKDFIGKSFGLLMHSYQLHPKETVDALSALLLGLSLGSISQVSEQKLLSLFQQSQRGHLARHCQLESMDPEALSHERAKFLHQELKGMSLS